MTETELQARFNRPAARPPARTGLGRRVAARRLYPAGTPAPGGDAKPWRRGWRSTGGRRLVLIAMVAAVALLMLAAAALGYRYFSEPVSPGFRLYLNKLASGPIRFDPAQARLRVGATVPKGVALLWTAPSKQYPGELVWGFPAQGAIEWHQIHTRR